MKTIFFKPVLVCSVFSICLLNSCSNSNGNDNKNSNDSIRSSSVDKGDTTRQYGNRSGDTSQYKRSVTAHADSNRQ
jgi:hypothetical protein